MIRQVLANFFEGLVYSRFVVVIEGLSNLVRVLINHVWTGANVVRNGAQVRGIDREGGTGAQITAWGSFALEVVRRNLRSCSFVSPENVYSLDSEA